VVSMAGKGIFMKRFSTIWAVDDPIDDLFEFMDAVEGYFYRYKRIITCSLLLILLSFLYVVLSIFLKLFDIGSLFFFSQSEGTFFLIESLSDLIIPVISLPFAIIVIILLLQNWKFYEVLNNRVSTIKKIWMEKPNDPSNKKDDENHRWNPMDLSLMLLDEIEQHSSQVRKQAIISMIALILNALIVSYVFFHKLIVDTVHYRESLFSIDSPFSMIVLVSTVFLIPFLMESYRFLSWQCQRFNIIKTIYDAKPPIAHSQSEDSLTRLKTYLQDDTHLFHKRGLKLESPCSIHGKEFDVCGLSKNRMLFVRKSKDIAPTKISLEKYIDDIQHVIAVQRNRPVYIRAIFLCDWRNEEGIITEDIEEIIYANPIQLRKGSGGDHSIVYVQIIIDNGSIYSMMPLVPEKKMDE